MKWPLRPTATVKLSRQARIVLALVGSWLLTGLVVLLDTRDFTAAHARQDLLEVFVAWSGELVFFTIVGLLIALVSLEKPQDPSTETKRRRLAIFLGGSTVPEAHHAQMVELLTEAAVYIRQASIDVTLIQRIDDHRAYTFRTTNKYLLVNPTRDAAAKIDFSYGYTPDNFPGVADDEPVGRYTSICIGADKKLVGKQPVPIPQSGLLQKIQIILPPDGAQTVTLDYEAMIAAGEWQRIRMPRFIERLQVRINNRCETLQLCTESGGPVEERVLFFDSEYESPTIDGILPRSIAFGFKIAAEAPPL